MIRIATLRRLLVPICFVAWAIVISLPGAACAQEVTTTTTPTGRPLTSYILPYVLVVVVIGLGIMVVARSSRRKLPKGERSPLKLGVGGHGAAEEDDSNRPGRRMKKAHRGGLLLGLTAAGFFCCPIISFVVISMANADLEEMETGRMDRAGEGKTKLARTLSIVVLVLALIQFIAGVVIGVMQHQ